MSEPDVISIRGAKEHNLKSVSLDIPKKKLVVFTGVSGSRKELARLRHPLRRGPAPLRGVPLGVRAPVPRADGEAQVRHAPRPLAHHLHRAEGGVATTRAPRWAPSPRSTTTCACSTPPSACSTAPTAAAGWASRARSRSSTRSSSLPAGTKLHAARAAGAEPQGRAQGPAGGRAEARLRPRARSTARSKGLEETIELDKKSKHDIELVVDRLVLKPDISSRGSPTRWRPRCARARASSSSPTRSARKSPTA